MSTDRFAARRDKLRRSLRKLGVAGLLVTHEVNVGYLTGFTGEDSYLLVLTRGGEVLLSDSRFTTQIVGECPGLECEIRGTGKKMLDLVVKAVKAAKPASLAIEAESMTVGRFQRIAEALPKLTLTPADDLVEQLRDIKDREEVAEIRRAIAAAETAFTIIKNTLAPDQTERDVSTELEYQMRKAGARGAAFETIVAVGDRAALPHARPTARRIGDNPLVLIDWGADGGPYKSDLTRILVTGKIPPKLERAYGVVLEANRRATDAIRPGVTGEQVDAVAREVIAKAGLGKHFTHSVGHGLGREVHETPRLAKNGTQPLAAGMVVTIEPGVYLPGVGGIRIEDDVLVTKAGREVLTTLPKSWEDTLVSA